MRIRGITLLLVLLTAGLAMGADERKLEGSQYADHVLDYFHRNTSEAYKAHGTRDARWDAIVIEAMEGHEKYMANILLDWNYFDAPPIEDVVKLYDKAVGMGCHDPLVWHYQERAVVIMHSPQRRPDFFDVIEPLAESKYPAMHRIKALAVLPGMGRPFRYENDTKWREQFADLAVEAVLDLPANADRRVFYNEFRGSLRDILNTEALEKRFFDGLEQRNADPWLLAVLKAENHIKVAWRARGGGWAANVKPEAWPVFHHHLDLSRQSLHTAIKLEPNYPEAATHMITIVMANGDDGSGDEWHWFEQARAAQFDYVPAYITMQQAMLGRWGGGPNELLALARKCMDGRRFDTAVPFILQHVMRDVIAESGSRINPLALPGVYDLHEEMYKGYLAQDRIPRDPDELRARWMAVAWKTSRFEKVIEIGQDVTTLREDVLKAQNVPVQRLQALLKATGEEQKALISTERTRSAGNAKAAAKQVVGVDSLPDDDPNRGTMVEIMRMLTAKEGPTELFPSNIHGLERLSGGWERQPDGSLTARGIGTHQMLTTGDLPPDVRITGTFTLTDPAGTTDGFGIVLRATNPEDGYLLHFQPKLGKVFLSGKQLLHIADLEVDKPVELDLTLKGNSAVVKINGKEIWPGEMSVPPAQARMRYGVLVSFKDKNAKAVIDNLKIQEIMEK